MQRLEEHSIKELKADKIISWTKRVVMTRCTRAPAGERIINFAMDEGEDRVKKTYGDNYETVGSWD